MMKNKKFLCLFSQNILQKYSDELFHSMLKVYLFVNRIKIAFTMIILIQQNQILIKFKSS